MGGIGKTALALEAAHRVVSKGLFPGGTLFVDLRGYDDNPVTADQAVLALLDALGVQGSKLPPTAARQYDAYHALLAERQHRTLLILDNASDPAQFLPLLPASDHHRVLITSRDRPDGLRVRLIDLEALTPAESSALITGALHDADERDDRPTREPDALRELTDLCCHLPLALQIAAAMLRRRRHRGIASLVAEIKEAEDATTAFDRGDLGTDQYGRSLALRPVLETSYHRLPADQARMLRLLALASGTETGTDAVAAMAGLDAVAAVKLLESLATTCLVSSVKADEGPDSSLRWRLHDLVRTFGVGVVAADAGLMAEGETAQEQLLDFYCTGADAADEWLRWLPGMDVPGRFRGRREALAWLDGERAGLVAAMQWAKRERFADTGVRLAEHLVEYLEWQRHFDDWVVVSQAAREAAHRSGDIAAEAGAWNNLGRALWRTKRMPQAVETLTGARNLFQAIGDRHGDARAWSNLGSVLKEMGRAAEAIEAFTGARDLLQITGDRHREAMVWHNLGNVLREVGRVEDAIEAHTQAHDMLQAAGDSRRDALTLHGLGNDLMDVGRVAEAVESFGKALRVYREFGDWYWTGQVFHSLALIHESANRPAEAHTCWLQAADAYALADDTAKADEARAWAEE
ncbi:tetratricopeptide repeat protein [Streptomyces sp. GQFP]|uniref:tetratricopeptide repeat protein n=1 Tax=Streptomyces sp. GQFP TaxID=2907545 RepID=UPI001F385B1B|nr:tetratricopeptide repeat protein [Streptomyces sp. GQFP]UIX35380.1 tetratricopeptide repeat protein [Streptomyces sp. GQFP]